MAVALVALGVSAAASAYAAKKSSNAAKSAANTQVAAGDRALAAQERGYQQQREDFSPYQQAGRSALERLGDTAGKYTGGMPIPQQSAGLQRTGGGMGQLGQPPQGMPGEPRGLVAPPLGMPAQGGLQATGQPPAGGMGQMPIQPGGFDMGQGGQAVPQLPNGGGPMPGSQRRVRAPTGEVALLPTAMAERAVSKGAKYVD